MTYTGIGPSTVEHCMTAALELRPGVREKATPDLQPLLAAMGSAAALCDRWGDVLGMAPVLERRVVEMDPRARTAWFAAVRSRVTRWDDASAEWHGELTGWRAHLYRVDVPGQGHVLVRFELPRAAALPASLRAVLTPREADVATGILEGLDSRSIAARHGVSVHTVRRVTERLFSKLRIHKRCELTQRALGLLEVGHSPHSVQLTGS
jgi:DNA-binding CsgD family transcriptional regulator